MVSEYVIIEVKSFDFLKLLSDVLDRWKEEANGQSFGIETDTEALLSDLYRLVGKDDTALFFVVSDCRVVGFMGMTIFTSPVGSQKIANEHCWYVLPEHRGIQCLRFIKEAEMWARAKGCSHLIMNASNLASDLHDRVCRLYVRAGMEKFETSYIRRLS